MSGRRLLSVVFAAVLLPLSLSAQQPAPGSYFGLRSASGAFISASPGEGVTLAPHLAG